MDVFTAMADSRNSGNIYVVKSKRQVGKSILAVCLMIKFCLESKCISVCVEPTQAQSRRIFKQLCDFLDGSGAIVSANSTLLTIQFKNGSELLFKSAEQRDALRGFTVSGILVIDEAAYIPDDIFEILYPTADANNAPLLIISTPLFCSGEFYELYTRGMGGDSRVTSFNWSLYDTSKYLSKEKLEYYRSTVSLLKFRSEYLGEFITEGSYLFGDFTHCIKGFSTKPSKYAGIDWAVGNGGDYTVLILMDEDGNITKIHSMRDKNPVEQISILSSILNSSTVKSVMVETNSIGTVFCADLTKALKKSIEVKKFTTTNESKRRIIEQLVAAFQKDLIGIPEDPELIRELQHYAVDKTSKGYTYNGADGVNDDYCMALAICYENYRRSNNVFRFSLV